MKDVERFKRIISYTELKAIRAMYEQILGTKDELIFRVSEVAKGEKITKSMFVTAFKLLEVFGVIDSKSLGVKGTYIKILDRETLDKIVS